MNFPFSRWRYFARVRCFFIKKGLGGKKVVQSLHALVKFINAFLFHVRLTQNQISIVTQLSPITNELF